MLKSVRLELIIFSVDDSNSEAQSKSALRLDPILSSVVKTLSSVHKTVSSHCSSPCSARAPRIRVTTSAYVSPTTRERQEGEGKVLRAPVGGGNVTARARHGTNVQGRRGRRRRRRRPVPRGADVSTRLRRSRTHVESPRRHA